jgi:hypothetical protein
MLTQPVPQGLDGGGLWTGKEQYPDPWNLCERLGVRGAERRKDAECKHHDEPASLAPYSPLLLSARMLCLACPDMRWKVLQGSKSTTLKHPRKDQTPAYGS